MTAKQTVRRIAIHICTDLRRLDIDYAAVNCAVGAHMVSNHKQFSQCRKPLVLDVMEITSIS